jgi:hypothetical protein
MWGEGPHGDWCETTTWRIRCNGCGERAWFFQCSHGSKVFFDELGPPWPIHDCDRSWGRGLRREIDDAGNVTVEVTRSVTVRRALRRFSIAPEVLDRPVRLPPEAEPAPIVRQDPTRTANEEYVGTVRELRSPVDPLAYYGLSDTTVARAGLGRIGRQPVGRITIHVPSPFGNETESYTAWIPTQLLADGDVRRGAIVDVHLEGVQLLDGQIAWFCSGVEVLG